jgi:hypothetical protein
MLEAAITTLDPVEIGTDVPRRLVRALSSRIPPEPSGPLAEAIERVGGFAQAMSTAGANGWYDAVLTVCAAATRADAAERERDHFESRLQPTLICESCDGAILPNDPDGNTCRGCGLTVCLTCVEVFDHLDNGLHAKGDPKVYVEDLRTRLAAAEDALLRKGYRRSCDIPACNCGDQWAHGGHAEERLHELSETAGELTQGKTLLTVLRELIAAAHPKEPTDGE